MPYNGESHSGHNSQMGFITDNGECPIVKITENGD